MIHNISSGKLHQMLSFKQRFLEDFGRPVSLDMNDKIYFYFQKVEGTKVVSKEALQQIYEYDCEDLFDFLRSGNPLLPCLIEETRHFFVFEYLHGEVLESITADDFREIERLTAGSEYTPFHNSMYTNIIKTGGKIKLIDFKHLDNKITEVDIDTFVFMHNNKNKICDLYIRNFDDLDSIMELLEKDYDLTNLKITRITDD